MILSGIATKQHLMDGWPNRKVDIFYKKKIGFKGVCKIVCVPQVVERVIKRRRNVRQKKDVDGLA